MDRGWGESEMDRIDRIDRIDKIHRIGQNVDAIGRGEKR
jgi:hypothetical protein